MAFKTKPIILCSALFLSNAYASTIADLTISGDTALFKLTKIKEHDVPSCVNATTKQLWAVDLTTHSGRAMYSNLVTAFSKDATVTVDSNSTCTADGIEVVKGLSISKFNQQSEESPVEFAGLIGPYNGKLNQSTHSWQSSTPSGLLNKACKAYFPTGRAMKWEEYPSIKGSIPTNLLSKKIWINDVVKDVSVEINDNKNLNLPYMIYSFIFKGGQVNNFDMNYNFYDRPKIRDLINCKNYTHTHAHSGITLNLTYGNFELSSCQNKHYVACVK